MKNNELREKTFEEGFRWGRASLKAELVKGLEGKRPKRGDYDGNDLASAEDYYRISAENWAEIIRLEDGINIGIDEAIELVKKI